MKKGYLILSLLLVSTVLALQDMRESDPAFKTVNKKVSLGRFVPNDLGVFRGIKMSRRIMPDLEKLLEAAKKDGLILSPRSGYRSYDHQVGTFNRRTERALKAHPKLTRSQAEEIANTDTARPGHSEHQLGTTVDVLSAENGYQLSSDSHLKYVSWLEKNAAKFNFKISYPKGSTEYVYEPWHIRWYPPSDHYLPTQNS